MKAVIQRVKNANVTINGKVYNSIAWGLLILLGIEDADDKNDISWLVNKIAALRVFDDEAGVMNLSVEEINGEVMVISQFTLHASTRKGNRPSYIKAAKPDISIPLYKAFVDALTIRLGKETKTGQFGANMQVGLVNDGPVTIIMDTKNKV